MRGEGGTGEGRAARDGTAGGTRVLCDGRRTPACDRRPGDGRETPGRPAGSGVRQGTVLVPVRFDAGRRRRKVPPVPLERL